MNSDLFHFFSRLFDPSGFPARWHCGTWAPAHGWLHILSDLSIWAAYFAIPVTLAYFMRRRDDLPFRSIFLLFAAFILLCGTTHLMEAIIFWWPAYRLAGVLKFLTAAVSWLTVFALIRVAPTLLSMRSPEALEQIVRERTAEVKAAMAAVEEERQLLRTTLASIGDAVITTDLEARVTNMNPVAESLTGWKAGDALGQSLETVFEIVAEDTREPVQNPALRALKEGVVVGLANHTILVRKDRTEVPIDDSAAPIRKDGETVGCVLVFRDITERRRQEAQQRERERQFVTLAESIPQLCWMANPNGEIFWYNQRWYEYTGTTPGEMEGWGWQSVHDPDVLERVLDRWRHSIATAESFEMVFPLRGADGVFRPFLTRVEPLKDDEGNVIRWFGTNTDISEQQRNEEALAAARTEAANAAALLDSLVTNAPIGIGIYDHELRFIKVNPALADINGIGQDEHLGKSLPEILPDIPEETLEEMRGVLRGGDPVVAREVVGRTPRSTDVRTWLTNFFPVADVNGTILGVGATVVEITELRRIEREREQALEDLSRASRKKDEFLATLSHELRNPLAPIRTGLQVLKLDDPDPDRAERSVEIMENQVEHLVRLVDDLLDMSRITRGKLELRRKTTEISTIIESAVEAAQPFIDEADHELIVTGPAEPIFVDADPTRLSQVFVNLLSNAAKYSDPGGQIRLSVTHEGDQVVVYVSDRGIGIDSGDLDAIFVMFNQAAPSDGESRGGLGIGLTLVRQLVEMHGGTVEAKSDGPGAGSEFVVRIPVTDAPSEAAVANPQPDAQTSSSLRILIVDDNEDGADMLQTLLEARGNEAHVAYDGEEGVSMAKQVEPDVILLDIGLPKLDGHEVCRRIRAESWGKDILIIAVTGWGQERDRELSRDAGFDHHMVKPVDLEELQRVIAHDARPPAEE